MQRLDLEQNHCILTNIFIEILMMMGKTRLKRFQHRLPFLLLTLLQRTDVLLKKHSNLNFFDGDILK